LNWRPNCFEQIDGIDRGYVTINDDDGDLTVAEPSATPPPAPVT
jgi:hypothetical protein